MTPDIPPVTDHLPIALRAFAGPQFTVLPEPDAIKIKRSRTILEASPWTLIFDTETTTHPGQALRFGTYQFRNGDTLDEAGIFYDPDGVSQSELATLRAHAATHALELRTREAFVDEVFFGRAYQLRATIVGFNLPFDISRIAIAHGTARNPLDSEASAMRGAFTFKLSEQKIWPNVRIKHLSQRTALIAFAATMQQRSSRGHRRRGLPVPVRRGHFIDVKTLAGALFARGFTLASLCKFLKVENPKREFEDFDGPVTDEMARYAVADVQATWESYAELLKRFDGLGLARTIPEKIYSEASIGKGYLREMGIAPWRDMQPDFRRDLLAKIMGSYFGGRSEIRIRREVRQVILCDFLSMYPTVCTLMGLWRFVIAEGMTWRDTTAQTRDFLESVDLTALQSQPIWKQLATLVRVVPEGDIFPVRAAYSGEMQTTIGANYLSSDTPLWFTLADCIAAKLLTGKTPKVIEAISFEPGPMQSGLQSINISGNPEYRVDPVEADFFKRVIELRQSIKSRSKAANGEEKAALDTEQNALKIAANATSYGVYVEINVEKRPTCKSVTVHSSTSETFSFKTDKAEMPGTYFHPLLATLITGAARLMLAIAECLVTDRQLDWAFCDTDSMAIAKPVAMQLDDFANHTRAIVDWFSALNPYAFGGSILKIESQNSSLETGEPEPLYCWAVSSKRYALFNLAPDGSPIMRKVSAHGLGHLLSPYDGKSAPANLPSPHTSVLGKGIERWHCDFWYQIVSAALAGHPDQVPLEFHPAMRSPAISRYGATTPELLRWFSSYNRDRSYREQVKPFGFMLAMTAALDFGEMKIGQSASSLPRSKAKPPKPIAPFDRDVGHAAASAFDRVSGAPISPSALKYYATSLAQYHLQPESKFLNADYVDRGTTRRRHIRMTAVQHIGKESQDWERQAMLGFDSDAGPEYGTAFDRERAFAELTGFVERVGRRKAGDALRTSSGRLARMRVETLPRSTVDRLHAAIEELERLQEHQARELRELKATVERDGLRPAARRLGVDPSNLSRRLKRQ
jgi:hypothetical protein